MECMVELDQLSKHFGSFVAVDGISLSVGKGEVLVTRNPFQVFAWVNRGHYRAGDDVQASFQA